MKNRKVFKNCLMDEAVGVSDFLHQDAFVEHHQPLIMHIKEFVVVFPISVDEGLPVSHHNGSDFHSVRLVLLCRFDEDPRIRDVFVLLKQLPIEHHFREGLKDIRRR